MKFVAIDGCPVPAEVAPLVHGVKDRTGAALTSCYRGNDPAALRILHANGHHSQQELYDATPAQRAAWGVLGQPDRPGTSTHECRSDGVAYPGPAGRPLAAWQVGFDWPNDSIVRVMAAFREQGQLPIHPYPSGLEFHHVNLGRAPKIIDPFLPLHQGDKGVFVWIASARLLKLGLLTHRTRSFGPAMEKAVRKYQHEHHLTADGVIGAHTWINLRASARAKRKGKHP